MRKRDIIGISALFTIAIGLITTGAALLETNLYAGITSIATGFGLMLLAIYLLQLGVVIEAKKLTEINVVNLTEAIYKELAKKSKKK